MTMIILILSYSTKTSRRYSWLFIKFWYAYVQPMCPISIKMVLSEVWCCLLSLSLCTLAVEGEVETWNIFIHFII